MLPWTGQKSSEHWQMLQGVGAFRRLTCAYVQLPTQIDSHPHRHAPLKLPRTQKIFIQITPNKNTNSPNSQRSQFGIKSVLHQMPCLPTLWQPTQLFRVQPTLFYTQLIFHMLHELAGEYLVRKYFLHQLNLIWQQYRWNSWKNVEQ